MATTPIIVTPALLPVGDWHEFRGMSESRADIALLIWAIVAAFCADPVELRVDTMQGDQLVESCEAYIRDHAEDAEKQTIEYGTYRLTGNVIMQVLWELELTDDYQRIKRNEQHLAYESEADHA